MAVVKGSAEISNDPSGIVEMIDTLDRPGGASAEGTYADTDTYAVGLEEKSGKRILTAGATASAGVGHARAELRVFEAEAKGPNASTGAVATTGTLSASASSGPLKATVGLPAVKMSFDPSGIVEMIDTLDRPGKAFAKVLKEVADVYESGIEEMIETLDRPCGASAEGTYADTDTYAVGLEEKPVLKEVADVYESGIEEMIETLDRPGGASAEGTYADTDTYAVGLENKPAAKMSFEPSGIVNMIDTLDRPGGASAEGTYADTDTYAVGLEEKPVVKEVAEVCEAGILEMINTFDRPGDAFAKGAYADTDTYAVGLENKPGKRIPKAGATASVGVGRARAEWSIFEAEAKGPNVSVGAVASAGTLSAELFARAGLGSASASAGPLTAKVGLSVDTGVSVGAGSVEGKLLGCGFSVGRKTGFSLFGTGIEFEFW